MSVLETTEILDAVSKIGGWTTEREWVDDEDVDDVGTMSKVARVSGGSNWS